MELTPLRFDPETLTEYVALFDACFPGSGKFSRDYLCWLYCANPAGTAIGFDAWADGKLAAHYACIPVDVRLEGQTVPALLSLNTATHPSHQGKGLFTKLAEQTYSLAAERGIDCIYGIANANSTPGFVRKLGFLLVEPLYAGIGFGSLNLDNHTLESSTRFGRDWSSASLAWRCANPANPVQIRATDRLMQCRARGHNRLLPAYAELALLFSAFPVGDDTGWLLPRLFLGLIPQPAKRPHFYCAIPQRLRPSPLNLIYRSLSGRIPGLGQGETCLSFLDFDAY